MYDLSILIPARNEMFLARTVEDILSNIEGKTEIIVVLDGAWADPGIADDERVRIIYFPESLGQRAATNKAAELSRAKYVMKVDAHCAFDKGFDVKMMKEMKDNWTMVPIMRNLHVFDWVCEDGHRRYQGPSGDCEQCGKPTQRDIVWNPKKSPQSKCYAFDSEPHFQYFGEFNKRPEGKGTITPSMSLQGSCWMLTREKYWELNVCDEKFGSWGSQGIEVAVKTWLSGGQVMCNQNTWYAHMFRTQGKDFGFPYDNPQSKVEDAKAYARNLFYTQQWDKAIYPLSWLVEKFAPVKNGRKVFWTEDDIAKLKEGEKPVNKGIIYYTDNRLNVKLAKRVQTQLSKMGLPIVSASLKPMTHFGQNIHLPLERGYLTMFKQQLAALEASTADVVYFCEHDVIYHPSHFKFVPPRKDTFYYNVNVWKVRAEDGHALWVNNCRQVSGIVVYRETALKHYRERVAYVEKHGFKRNMGFEPGTHNRVKWEYEVKSESWMSEFPNIDMRHDKNLTQNRWSPDLFRDKRNCQGWTEKKVNEIKGWENFKY